MKKETELLIQYRLKEAIESLEEARILLKENKTRGAMNRTYYGMFYATLALLTTKDLFASKHTGVIALFHKEFVKTGLFPKELAKDLDIAFDLRTKGDYRDFVDLERERLTELFANAVTFVDKIKEVIDIRTKC